MLYKYCEYINIYLEYRGHFNSFQFPLKSVRFSKQDSLFLFDKT